MSTVPPDAKYSEAPMPEPEELPVETTRSIIPVAVAEPLGGRYRMPPSSLLEMTVSMMLNVIVPDVGAIQMPLPFSPLVSTVTENRQAYAPVSHVEICCPDY